jgi:tetratricopeptide (TPR) repeat protein
LQRRQAERLISVNAPEQFANLKCSAEQSIRNLLPSDMHLEVCKRGENDRSAERDRGWLVERQSDWCLGVCIRPRQAGCRVHWVILIAAIASLVTSDAMAISGKRSSVCGAWNNYCEGPSPTPRVEPRPEELRAARQQREAIQLNESANDAVRAGNNHRAAELYRAALRLSPDDPVIGANLLETEGVIAWEAENFELALRNIKQAHALRPLKHRADYISQLNQLIADKIRAARERAAEAERKALEYASEGARRQAQEMRDIMRAPVETQSAHEKRFPPPPPPIVPKNRALIGGMTWEYGTYAMNVPTSLSRDRALHSRLVKEFVDRMKLRGVKEDRLFDPKDYNFILGVARSSNVWGDLPRVLLDDLDRGRATPAMQREYDLLRNRTFDALDCHSNGAMICLAALSKSHITLTEPKIVRLFGPQITHGALVQWQDLATKHKLDLRIYFNDGDAVPRISYLAQYLIGVHLGSGFSEFTEAAKDTLPVTEAVAREILLGDGLKAKIERDVPSAKVQSFTCGYVRDIHFWSNCHKLSVYQNFIQ